MACWKTWPIDDFPFLKLSFVRLSIDRQWVKLPSESLVHGLISSLQLFFGNGSASFVATSALRATRCHHGELEDPQKTIEQSRLSG